MKTATWQVEIDSKLVASGTAAGEDIEKAKTAAMEQIVTAMRAGFWTWPLHEHVQHSD